MYSADSYQSIKSPSDLEDEQRYNTILTRLYQTGSKNYERKSVGRRGGRK